MLLWSHQYPKIVSTNFSNQHRKDTSFFTSKRLISAWNEKLNRNHQYGSSMFHREHNLASYAKGQFQMSRSHAALMCEGPSLRVPPKQKDFLELWKDHVDSHFISFRDFARWIAFDDYKQKNKHFRPQSYMCPPCKTRYSFVIKECQLQLKTFKYWGFNWLREFLQVRSKLS